MLCPGCYRNPANGDILIELEWGHSHGVPTAGCSQPVQPPAEFTRQIFLADSILATNKYDATTFMLSGEDVGRVGKAVASAKLDKNHYQAIFDWDLRFYTGSNFLTVIHFQDAAFWAGGTQYVDETGVLKTLYDRLGNKAESR